MSAGFRYRAIADPRALQAVGRCPDDGTSLVPTGSIATLDDDPGPYTWYVQFRCPLHPREMLSLRAIGDLEPIAAAVLAGLDVPAALAAGGVGLGAVPAGHHAGGGNKAAPEPDFLQHDLSTAGSLAQQLDEAQVTKDDVLRYLDGARVLRSARRLLPDGITGEPFRIADSVRTDGTWRWHESLNYHVRHHDIRVPAALMDRVRRAGGPD